MFPCSISRKRKKKNDTNTINTNKKDIYYRNTQKDKAVYNKLDFLIYSRNMNIKNSLIRNTII